MSILESPASAKQSVVRGVGDGGGAEYAQAPGYGRAPGRRHFWLRRLHSLTGLVFGGYITVHLLVNATGLWPRDYQLNVDKIHSLEPMLWLVELTAIFIPLLIHALYGIYITKAGVKFNTTKYAYGGNVRYTLQRWTAVFLLVFIGFHVATLHRWGLAGIAGVMSGWNLNPNGGLAHFRDWCNNWGGLFNARNQAFQSTVSGVGHFFDGTSFAGIGNPLIVVFYLLGIYSATFHWANGLWTSAIAWGLTTTANAQRRWGHVCLGFGIVLTVIGTIALCAFTIAPAARGDTSRWNDATHTLPEESALHEQDQGTVTQKQQQLENSNGKAPAATP